MPDYREDKPKGILSDDIRRRNPPKPELGSELNNHEFQEYLEKKEAVQEQVSKNRDPSSEKSQYPVQELARQLDEKKDELSMLEGILQQIARQDKGKWSSERFNVFLEKIFFAIDKLDPANLSDNAAHMTEELATEFINQHEDTEDGFYYRVKAMLLSNTRKKEAVFELRKIILEKSGRGEKFGCPRCCELLIKLRAVVNDEDLICEVAQIGKECAEGHKVEYFERVYTETYKRLKKLFIEEMRNTWKGQHPDLELPACLQRE